MRGALDAEALSLPGPGPRPRGAANVAHLNVVDFAASVAIAGDRSLADRPFVIAASAARGAIVLGLSPRARKEGLETSMSLAQAGRRVAGLLAVPPDPLAAARADEALAELAARYAPLVQADSGGHLYLDLGGTERLFGPAIDCAVRIRNEIRASLGIEATMTVARNKLVAKVAARSITPAGIACVRPGDEAAFLAPQDSRLLPGMGPSIVKVLAVTGLRSIGDIAALGDEEALALFGRQGPALRDSALGIDASTVAPGRLAERSLRRLLEFAEDLIDAREIRAALLALVEDAGLELRRSLLATRRLRLEIIYADAKRSAATEASRGPLVLDSELIAAADRAFAKTALRRVRLRALTLELGALESARREPDLFIPAGSTADERLQKAVDASRLRYGAGTLTRGSGLP